MSERDFRSDTVYFIAANAALIFSGVAGKWVILTPQALLIAFMMAEWGVVKGSSPQPPAPKGPYSRGVST